MMTDPISDMLTRIRNAGRVRHAEVRLPASGLKAAIAQVLVNEGFVAGVRADTDGRFPEIVLSLRYADTGAFMIDGIRRVSRPSCRVYRGSDSIPRVRNGMGMTVVSTSQGVMCDRDARAANLGGEVLCEVW